MQSPPKPTLSRLLTSFIVFAAIIFVSALFGILTRPLGFLASFWPANAILLGLMIRLPRMAIWPGWLGAAVGYLAADLVTGGGLPLTLWLTAGNLAGAMTGYLLLRPLPEEDRTLGRPSAVTRLLLVCIAAAAASGLVGCGAMVVFFNQHVLQAFGIFFVSELGCYLIVLPVLLTAPSLKPERRVSDNDLGRRIRKAAPAAALVVTTLLGAAIGGPGALAVAMPAVVWCALTYNPFSTAAMMFIVGLWYLLILSSADNPASATFFQSTVSVRLGAGLLALGPIAIASANSARERLIQSLNRAVCHDALTNALSRTAFFERGGKALVRAHGGPGSAVLMIDLDHFKQINDRFGHAAGDAVLAAVGQTIRGLLRQNDLFGRLGGEEFAVLLPATTGAGAATVAERIRKACAELDLTLDGGETIAITVSIGVAFVRAGDTCLLVGLKNADSALYDAKRGGRNRTTEWRGAEATAI